MIKELQKLTKEQLLALTKHFEYYPAVTDSDDIGYILAYLEDESCEINHNEIIEYLYKEVKLEITQENLHLYYKFMNDEDLIQNSEILNDLLVCRFHKICSLLSVSAPMLHSYSSYNYYNAFFVKQFIFGIKDNLNPIEDFIEDIKNSDAFKEFKRDILIQEANDITNVVIIDFSEDEVAEYIERCIKYLNKRFDSKYVLEVWETDEVYGQRDDEDDYSEEYQGHSMYQGKIAIYDGVFEKDIKFTGIYCEVSAVFSDLLSSLETIEKETISKAS